MGDTIIKNRKARHSFEILESIEAGIMLIGTEVKSLRNGKANLSDSYALFYNGELFLQSLHIAHFKQAGSNNHEEKRKRKLLLHKKELDKISAKMKKQNLTLVPLALYWKNNRVKVELGLARGKKLFDKREDAKKKDAKRDIDRARKSFD